MTPTARQMTVEPMNVSVLRKAVIALKKLGTKLAWDGQMRQFTNCPEANALLAPPPFRAGWKL